MKRLYFILFGLLLLAAGVKAQIPKLNSYPSASATIFLDFDGQAVTGTLWNWGGPIYAQPSGFSNSAITEIFNRVSEDYRPFNINITTDSTVYLAAPIKQRTRVIITPTNSWYGSSAGGVAFVGSFTFGDDTPAWVFSNLLGNSTKNVAEACSHESGHTLGLQHQSTYDANCNKTAEYSSGTGSGEIGWAPIMGNSYARNLTTWHKGTNSVSCSTIQDDMAVIAGATNGFGYRPASVNTDIASATNIPLQTGNILVDGTISRTGEINAFKIVVPNNTTLTLNATPESIGTLNGINNNGANIDIRVKILNSNKDTIGTYNPATLLNAGIDTSLYTGTYYLLVDGASNANMAQYGSLGYYSLAGSLAVALPLDESKQKKNPITPPTNTNKEKAVQLSSTVITNSISIKSNGKHLYQLADVAGRLLSKGELQNGLNTIDASWNTHGLLFLRLSDGVTEWTEKLIKQ